MKKNDSLHDIIVIGASAGGLEAISSIVSELSNDLPASVFVVLHMSAISNESNVVQAIAKHTPLKICIAKNNLSIEKGTIYLAPPNRHMMIKDGHVLVTDGPRENRFRPSIDTLFRSAAVNYSSRVIGVILTGMLDDGTAGLMAIKESGGIAVVQDPKDAPYPDMPLSAFENVVVDFSSPASKLGHLLNNLVYLPAVDEVEVPEQIKKEAMIAERVIGGIDMVEQMG